MTRRQQRIRNRIVGVNIGPRERVASGIGGALLAAVGLGRRSGLGLLAAGVGALAIARAVSGRCPWYRARALRKGLQIRRAVTIQCTPQEVYELWREPANLPRFMQHVTSVIDEGGGITRWVVEHGGRRLAWRARLVEDTPGRRLRWRSLPGGDVKLDASLELRHLGHDRGTEVEVKVHYLPPGGLAIASTLDAFLRRLARAQVGIELARLRQLIETGEIATGARRRDELERAPLSLPRMPPVTTAQTSAWPTVTGEGR